MASRKEYEMLFQLNARMNGGFSETISKAQAEFVRLGKEVQELGRLQKDVSGYQKQQAAVENTTGKLDNLKQRYALLEKQIGETTGSTATLERQKLALAQRIKDTETALERQSQKLEATGARLREAGIDTENLAGKDAELASRIKELKAEQDKAADSAASFGERTSQAFDAAGQAIAAAGVAVAVKEITDAFLQCVEGAGSLEEALSTVEALSGANAQEMAALAAEAKELGATTKFTAKESADAMGYMAMAGWDANDMLQGMDGVLQLAAASGEDLAMVSDIVTDSLSAFGLTAKDTAHFSDVLAAAATSSNTNVCGHHGGNLQNVRLGSRGVGVQHRGCGRSYGPHGQQRCQREHCRNGAEKYLQRLAGGSNPYQRGFWGVRVFSGPGRRNNEGLRFNHR